MPVSSASPLPLRAAALLILPLFCVLLSSCVTSFFPLAESEKEMVYRPELHGTWKEAEGESLLRVEEGEGPAYNITLVETRSHDSVSVKDTTYFTGHLVEESGYLLLYCSVNLDQQADYHLLGDYTKAGLVPTYFLFHLTLKDNNRTVELAQLEEDPVEHVLRQKKAHYRRSKESQSLVLLEPPATLRKLLVSLIREDADLWDKSTWIKQ